MTTNVGNVIQKMMNSLLPIGMMTAPTEKNILTRPPPAAAYSPRYFLCTKPFTIGS
jgi:hypothetical protein